MKNIVITGSSRGIGFGMAVEFLKRGHRVTISGRDKKTLETAANILSKQFSKERVTAVPCDVSSISDIEKLWTEASRSGNIDIWINNAGIGQGTLPTIEIDVTQIDKIVDTNIKGVIFGSKIALKNMLIQGSGAIYNMEGFGSDGRKMKSMSLYGTSKYALRYFTRSLALEASGSPVIVGAISPGMVVTDLLIDPISSDKPINRQASKIFHILADRVETVTPWLVDKMLANKKNNALFNWLNSGKVMLRFLKNLFRKRKVEGIPEY